MASNLMKKGKNLVVYDVSQTAIKALTSQGAQGAGSPSEVAQQCDRIITMLPTNAHVEEVYGGPNGVLTTVKSGSLLIDSSTVDPETSRAVSRLASDKGAIFMDAPVTGAQPAAKAGTLTFMVGAPKEADAESIRELLLCMGKNFVYCGPVGTGEIAKICNNVLLAITMVGTAETMNMAERLGLDAKLMTKILNISSGRSWSSEVYHPVPGVMENVPSSNGYQGGFRSVLMTKDLGLATSAATRSNSPTPMGALARQVYLTMINNGFADKDFSSVYEYLKEKK
jgi:3-hydroxyisobutyrate dehydrogenase